MSGLNKLLVLFAMATTLAHASKTNACYRFLQKDEFVPADYVQTPRIHTDGKGQLMPPIGSKIFIAWRNRTPPHIPDSAYFKHWAKPQDIIKLWLEYEKADLDKETKIYSTQESIKKATGNYLRFNSLLNEKALTFINKRGVPYVIFLSYNTHHNHVAERILDTNPDLYFLSADNYRLNLILGPNQKIARVWIKKTEDSSLYLSPKVWAALAPESLRSQTKVELVEKFLRVAIPDRLDPAVIFAESSEPAPPAKRERPTGGFNSFMPHMLK